MHLFDIPCEIRLKIYSELLVLSEPIVFLAEYFSPSLPLFWSQRGGLCPALLRVNKRIYHEASTLLYSNNNFRFPNLFPTVNPETYSADIALFLHQVGSQASHIRHICIPFPHLNYSQPGNPRFYEAYIKHLDLIRDTCTSIRTLELLISLDNADHIFTISSVAAEALHLLETHFKNVPSLKEFVIHFEVWDPEDLNDDLTIKIRDYGWTIKVTEQPGTWMDENERRAFVRPYNE